MSSKKFATSHSAYPNVAVSPIQMYLRSRELLFKFLNLYSASGTNSADLIPSFSKLIFERLSRTQHLLSKG